MRRCRSERARASADSMPGNRRRMELAVFRTEYSQGIEQETWVLLADAVTDAVERPSARRRNPAPRRVIPSLYRRARTFPRLQRAPGSRSRIALRMDCRAHRRCRPAPWLRRSAAGSPIPIPVCSAAVRGRLPARRNRAGCWLRVSSSQMPVQRGSAARRFPRSRTRAAVAARLVSRRRRNRSIRRCGRAWIHHGRLHQEQAREARGVKLRGEQQVGRAGTVSDAVNIG